MLTLIGHLRARPSQSHIAAFEAALKSDDDGILEGPDTSPRDNLSRESSFYGDYPGSSNLNSPHATMRVRKISALSDFAPINTRVSSKKRRRTEREGKHSEIGFLIFRWPLLVGFHLLVILWHAHQCFSISALPLPLDLWRVRTVSLKLTYKPYR